MSQLPQADITPLKITGTFFKDLVFAFEPQNIPDGAGALRRLKTNSAIIVDEVDDASIVLVDPEHEGTAGLLQEAANKVVLHYSWVNKSLISGRPLVEPDNWGNCKVTLDNINDNFSHVLPPTLSNLQLQTPRPTPENRSHNLSTLSGFSQNPAGVPPPSSRPPETPTPSQWNRDPVMLQPQTPQLPLTNQVAPHNMQPIQSPSMFAPFPTPQPAEMAAVVYGQQQAWPHFRPRMYGAIQPPTMEEFRHAYEVMMWFQGPTMYQHLLPPPTPTQPGPTFHPSPQHPPSTAGIQPGGPTVPGTPITAALSRQDSTGSHATLPDLGDPPVGPPPDSPPPPASPLVQSTHIPLHPPSDEPTGPREPKLFEYRAGESNDSFKSIMFCIPITVKIRGRLAEIFRVTGGGFTDDVEDADYVVLDRWEGNYFDEVWYCAQDNNKPTVTPGFVIDSYEKGKLMDPNDYPTLGPRKPRKGQPKKVKPRPSTSGRKRRGRGRGGARVVSPHEVLQYTPPDESPKWLRFFKEAEYAKSLQYIGAMFKKNAELTHDALAIHLNHKMPNHTINSWKKFCLYHIDMVEDLRTRAVGNAERRTAPEDMDTTGIGATEATGTGASEVAGTGASGETETGVGEAIGAVAGDTAETAAVGATLPIPQQTNTHESQPPPPPCEKVAGPGPILVKMEPLDDDQLDFAFAADVLASWNANEESDAALWKRMESMRPSSSAPSWEVFCERNRTRFEQFFASKST